MVDDVGGVGGVEVGKNWHNHSAVCYCGGEHCHPVDGVLSQQGNLVALLNAALLEYDVHLGNVTCQFAVSDSFLRGVVGKSREVAVFAETFFVNLDKVFLQHKFLDWE